MGFLCIASMEKSFSTHSLSFRKAMRRSTTLFPLSKQGLYESQFLQKLSCQKPYWDQARLSSLVNKQVAVIEELRSGMIFLSKPTVAVALKHTLRPKRKHNASADTPMDEQLLPALLR